LIGVFDNGFLDKDIRIYVRNANGGTKVVTGLGPTNTSDISWSPGGKQLASDSGGDDPVIFTVRVATGKLTGPDDPPPWIDGDDPDWSPDGAWICYQSSVGGLALVRPDGQGKTPLTSSGFQPDWSPDGKRSEERRVGKGG